MAEEEGGPVNAQLFSDFCTMLHNCKIQKSDKKNVITNYINEVRMKVAGKKNSSMFPILRLLLPKEERERNPYNLKENKLGKLLVKVLGLSEKSKDGNKLLNFTSVNSAGDGDFAGAAYHVLNNRIGKNSGTYNIGNINDILDRLADAEVGNKAPSLDAAMSDALKNLSPKQMMWLLRIILKDLKLGLGTASILAAFHPDAPELYVNCGNLSKVCEDLEDGETRPPELGIKVFFAVRPMLSERLDVLDVPKLPQGKTYHIETKFDGERFQIHMENGVFEYYSRKGYPYSDTYGKTYDTGLLTPFLKDCFSASVTSFILDGEMMGWHKLHQCFGSKGMAFDVKKLTDKSKFRPCFVAYDVLYFNGKSLVGPPDKGGVPLSARLKIQQSIFTEVEGYMYHSKRATVKENVDVLTALNKAIDDQDEGIVVKDVESYYIANRRNAGWYKVKPEYTENAMTDMDLVIIGADEAESKRQGQAKSFLVACADKATPDDSPHRWVCVGRVSTGLSYEEREGVCATLSRHWVVSRRSPPPQHLVFNKEKPDFWILPEHSVAVQVRATELIRSSHFGADYTLRFPRVIKIRDDKPIDDVMTLNEYNQLADKKLVSKLGTKRINEDQMTDEIKTRKKRTTKPLEVAEEFRAQATGDVEITSKALFGRKIHILSEDEDCKKSELIRIIESHSGKHIANPSTGSDTWCCVVGRQSSDRIRTLIKLKEFDITTTSWLRSLPPMESPCVLAPLDMLSIKKSTRLALGRKYDRFGDSYIQPVNEDTLKKCFDKMDNEEPEIYLTDQEMQNLDDELFTGKGDNLFSFLRTYYIHFVDDTSINVLLAKMYGGTVCGIRNPNLTHLVVPKGMTSEDVKQFQRKESTVVVSEEWLDICFKEKKYVSETNFIIHCI